MCDIYLDQKYQETIYKEDAILDWVGSRKHIIGNRTLTFIATANEDVLELWIGKCPPGRDELVFKYFRKHRRLPPT